MFFDVMFYSGVIFFSNMRYHEKENFYSIAIYLNLLSKQLQNLTATKLEQSWP